MAKTMHSTPEIAGLCFAVTATFLALSQILLQKQTQSSLSQVLLFVRLTMNGGMDREKAPEVTGIRICQLGWRRQRSKERWEDPDEVEEEQEVGPSGC